MTAIFPTNTDDWILEKGPTNDIVVSSRARLARNLPKAPFAPSAPKSDLARIAARIHEVIDASPELRTYLRFDVTELTSHERRFLRESHLISADLEKGREHREVYLNSDASASIMVNEEDHIRMQAMLAGYRTEEAYQKVNRMEEALEKVLELAYNPQFGYLTACPTNTGTGLRVSIMLHLVALAMTNQLEEAFSNLAQSGLVVRGAYGEHSNNIGDLFQISNEVTLGKSEAELIEILGREAARIIDREREAREFLFKQAQVKCEDAIERAIGTLSRARAVDTAEAATLLSRVRLAVGRGFGLKLTHEELSRLMIEIQPAHLLRRTPSSNSDERDVARADYLRAKFNGGSDRRN